MPTKVKLSEASQAQLHAYVTITLGAPLSQVPTNTGAEKLRAKIMTMNAALEGESEIIIPDGAVALTPADRAPGHGGAAIPNAQQKPVASHGLYDPKVEVTLHKTEANKGEPVEAAVNGRTMLIPVGQRVAIPYRYYLALMNAEQTVYTFNSKTNENEPRVESRHTMNVHRMPSEEEIAAWDHALSNPGETKAA